MDFNRAEVVDHNFTKYVSGLAAAAPRAGALDEPVRPGSALTGRVLLDLFDAQMTCRHLDLMARLLRSRDAGYYTIGSAGHEGNVVLGAVVRCTDPSFLHYRSGALMIQRSKQVAGIDPILDTLLSQAAAADDPIAGGRHKVWGSRALWVPPQTSTIASHLPKAVGAAIALGRGKKLRLPLPVPEDSIVMCSFGDASVNHSVAQAAFNSASWTAYQRVPVPVLFVCEDNGIGISVHTPPGWVGASMRNRAAIRYVSADAQDLPAVYDAAYEAVEHCRAHRAPVFLHLHTVRLMGHAGVDPEFEYHTLAEIEAAEQRDALLRSAETVVGLGLMSPQAILERYEALRARVAATAEDVVRRPKLQSAAEVMRPLAPYDAEAVRSEVLRRPAGSPRGSAGQAVEGLPPLRGPRHLAVLINRALHEALEKYPEALVFGEDVAQRGGVYYVTQGLWKRFGAARVFNTLLDETTILGLAAGAAHLGFLPIPEIQYLAYYHNAEDQIRGEACSLQFFSNGQFANPMVVRIAGLAYQRGFGGHFHNDNSLAALRDIPGLILAVPARGDDAVRMFRTCLAAARVCGRVAAFVEPIALYMTKDLYETGDGGWSFEFPAADEQVALGEGRVYHPEARDLLIVTYGNGLYMSLRVVRRLAEESGLHARVLDLRWLNPLNHDFVAEHARTVGRVLVVDECRRAGGVGEAIVAGIVERCGGRVAVRLLAAQDTYVPLGPAMRTVMPSEEDIAAAARSLADESPAACGAGTGGEARRRRGARTAVNDP